MTNAILPVAFNCCSNRRNIDFETQSDQQVLYRKYKFCAHAENTFATLTFVYLSDRLKRERKKYLHITELRKNGNKLF